MSENTALISTPGNPYKIVDCNREKRKGITASSLEDLINVARNRLAIPSDADLTIVLEQDGKLFFLLHSIMIQKFYYLIIIH